MLDKNTIIKVTNRDNGTVGYTIPDLGNLHRLFQAGETKEITMEELRKLSYVTGGNNILKNYLILDNEEAIRELLSEVEPEYYYSEEDVKKLLLQGTLDQFEDCLNFAPEGIINLVKKLYEELKDIPAEDLQKEFIGKLAEIIHNEEKKDSQNESSIWKNFEVTYGTVQNIQCISGCYE